MSGDNESLSATSAQVATALMNQLQAHARMVRSAKPEVLRLMASTPEGRQQLSEQLGNLRHWLAIIQPASREVTLAADSIVKAMRKAGRFSA